MRPDAYETWYESPRGRWISDVEYRLLAALLRAEPDASLLDVGCGTGHFTRLFARDCRGPVVGLDPDEAALAYARRHAAAGERYVAGGAEALPFSDRSFDYAVSVTALCFIDQQLRALQELVRVARRRVVVGVLNRHSLLYLAKGRGGGRGGYRGAHWHTAAEIRSLFAGLPVTAVRLRTAVVVPGVGALGRAVERCWPSRVRAGGFLAASAEPLPPG